MLLRGEEVPPLSLLCVLWSQKTRVCSHPGGRRVGSQGFREASADPTAGQVLWAGDSALSSPQVFCT